MSKHCKYFLPWITTSHGEINTVCVDNEKRTSKRCPFENKWEECPDFVPAPPVPRG